MSPAVAARALGFLHAPQMALGRGERQRVRSPARGRERTPADVRGAGGPLGGEPGAERCEHHGSPTQESAASRKPLFCSTLSPFSVLPLRLPFFNVRSDSPPSMFKEKRESLKCQVGKNNTRINPLL